MSSSMIFAQFLKLCLLKKNSKIHESPNTRKNNTLKQKFFLNVMAGKLMCNKQSKTTKFSNPYNNFNGIYFYTVINRILFFKNDFYIQTMCSTIGYYSRYSQDFPNIVLQKQQQQKKMLRCSVFVSIQTTTTSTINKKLAFYNVTL